jgi:N-acetylmuramoyl-L-alanine amidase
MRSIKWIILHCTAGPQDQKTAVILSYWKSLGYRKPGYHHLISVDGSVENLQPIELPSNGVAGFNAHSINICYKGGVGPHGEILDNRTTKQIESMLALVRKYHAEFPEAIILGHRDLSPDKNRNGVIDTWEWKKACPSFSVKKMLEETGITNPRPIPEAKKLVDTASDKGVNVRMGPGTNYDIMFTIDDGVACIVLGQNNGWSQVQVSDDKKGWVKSEFLK